MIDEKPTHAVALKRGKSPTCDNLPSALSDIEGVTVHHSDTEKIVMISGHQSALDRVRLWAGEDYWVEPIINHFASKPA